MRELEALKAKKGNTGTLGTEATDVGKCQENLGTGISPT